MAKKDTKIRVNGRLMYASKYVEAVTYNRQASKYINARRDARKRSKQIHDMSGPASMEWVQSALFLYAARANGLKFDLQKALWAYTSAMVVKLEEFVTNYEKIAQKNNVEDAYHWTALQLRACIRNHMKLLEMFKDEVIQLPDVSEAGWNIQRITHRPRKGEADDAMSYMLTDFKKNNPDAKDIVPKKDDEY